MTSDALEVGIGPRAFADAARFGCASLARSPLQGGVAVLLLASGIALAGVCLALAARVVGQGMRGPAPAVLLAAAVPILLALVVTAVPVLLALVATAAHAAARLIRRAVTEQREAAPCSGEEARGAPAVLCAMVGPVALGVAAAATGRFPAAVQPGGWGWMMGIGAVLGPVLLLGVIATTAVRRWAVDRHPA